MTLLLPVSQLAVALAPSGPGRFTTSVPRGRYRLRVRGPRVGIVTRDVEVLGDRAVVAVPLAPAPQVVLRLTTPDATAIGDDTVVLRISRGDETICNELLSLGAGSSGEWTNGLEPGRYAVEAKSFRGLGARRSFVVPADATSPIEIDLPLRSDS